MNNGVFQGHTNLLGSSNIPVGGVVSFPMTTLDEVAMPDGSLYVRQGSAGKSSSSYNTSLPSNLVSPYSCPSTVLTSSTGTAGFTLGNSALVGSSFVHNGEAFYTYSSSLQTSVVRFNPTNNTISSSTVITHDDGVGLGGVGISNGSVALVYSRSDSGNWKFPRRSTSATLAGGTWSEVGTNLDWSNSPVCMAENDTIFYVLYASSIYRSLDSAATWSSVGVHGVSNPQGIAVSKSTGTVIVVGINSGLPILRRSTNQGVGFSTITLPAMPVNLGGNSVVGIAHNGNRWLFVASIRRDINATPVTFALTSDNDGVSWNSPVMLPYPIIRPDTTTMCTGGNFIAANGSVFWYNTVTTLADGQNLVVALSKDGVEWNTNVRMLAGFQMSSRSSANPAGGVAVLAGNNSVLLEVSSAFLYKRPALAATLDTGLPNALYTQNHQFIRVR